MVNDSKEFEKLSAQLEKVQNLRVRASSIEDKMYLRSFEEALFLKWLKAGGPELLKHLDDPRNYELLGLKKGVSPMGHLEGRSVDE